MFKSVEHFVNADIFEELDEERTPLLFRLLLGNTDIGVLTAAVVCFTMAVTVLIAKLIGCTLPMCARKLGFDPAVMASPFITTIVDALSLLVYFGVARALLFG